MLKLLATLEADSTQEVEESDDDDAVERRLKNASFGSLARLQDELASRGNGTSRKRKREGDKSEDAEAKLEALRKRLRELRESKVVATAVVEDGKSLQAEGSSASRNTRRRSDSSEEDASEDDSSASESDDDDATTVKKGRSSKHAPTSQSSKRAVTRRRTVIPLAKSTVRDPRFDPLSGPLLPSSIAKKYSFLETYRASELTALRTSLKAPNLGAEEKDSLRRQLLRMQSQQQAKERDEQERSVLREHRRKERDAVVLGKQPFYLKKSAQRQQALVQRFAGLKDKQRDHAVERRRKKLTAKERRGMPDARRA